MYYDVKPISIEDAKIKLEEKTGNIFLTFTIMEENKKVEGKLVEETKKSFVVNEVDGTPFVLLITDEKVRIGCAGKLCSNEEFKTEEEALQYIESKPWELITNLVCLAYEKLKNDEK